MTVYQTSEYLYGIRSNLATVFWWGFESIVAGDGCH
jgi:hypothetical protein